jgi:hypothetical protein
MKRRPAMNQIKTNSTSPSVHCNVFDYCSGNQHEKARCWEVAQLKCDFHYVFNVCTDCIVYLYENNSMDMPRKDIENILQQRETAQEH